MAVSEEVLEERGLVVALGLASQMIAGASREEADSVLPIATFQTEKLMAMVYDKVLLRAED